ncbi:DUF29 domain-containing protein [Acidisoma cellulosilytica]|uniref:DUF29 domain-containing protein n=1 Tax=Acidisoma cellulosilyticum TaxID=2802395 RepID=A0A964E3B5_9PROT|nr:DUF29 domain-containing protein [Acidisoma cellulosilyticum]MCB8879678.1 DUF29 domain-containing protein [Acidisoma cellulosilyticum]
MPDQRYDSDVLAWGEHQADLLRRLSRGEPVNEAPDWTHVIEEIEEVGLSELRACRSLLARAMVHLVKLHLSPEAEAAGHWRAETAAFLAGARRSFAPSMRQRIDLDQLWQDALYEIRAEAAVGTALALPTACPWPLDVLISDRPDPRDVQAMIATTAEG